MLGFFGREVISVGTKGSFQSWIIEQNLNTDGDRVLNFLKYVVILQFIIPISLVVAMEIVKFYQIV